MLEGCEAVLEVSVLVTALLAVLLCGQTVVVPVGIRMELCVFVVHNCTIYVHIAAWMPRLNAAQYLIVDHEPLIS